MWKKFAQMRANMLLRSIAAFPERACLLFMREREMMEEDGVPLTKANAEDLIEEAADKAEKRSFGGMFSSKYDKDGLLILKEKHFFD